MYSTMFPEDCGKRDLFHFHLSQPRNISSLDKIKSMFCRFKKNSLVTSNVIYLIFTNIKSCNFFPCYFHWSSDMYTLMYYTYYALRTRLYFLTVQIKGIIYENNVLKCIFSIKMKEIPFVYNYGMPACQSESIPKQGWGLLRSPETN